MSKTCQARQSTYLISIDTVDMLFKFTMKLNLGMFTVLF